MVTDADIKSAEREKVIRLQVDKLCKDLGYKPKNKDTNRNY